MSGNEDDVLSVSAETDSEFSGFEPADIVQPPEVAKTVEVRAEEVVSPKKKKGKSPVKGKKVVKSSTKTKKKPKTQSAKPGLDLNRLSEKDIGILKKKLGLSDKENRPPDFEYYSDEEFFDHHSDFSEPEIPGPSSNKTLISTLEKELFGGSSENEDDWCPPRLKTSERDKPISGSLANLVNVACTSQCDLDEIIARHKIPENVDKAGPPLVNSEIWKILDRKVHSQDKYMSDVQNIVAAAMVPVIKLAGTFRKSLNKEAKTLVSDILTLIGQVQYNLSVRRRYNIRPHLKKKYQSLCSISMPITTQLFGDDISKEIKSCDSLSNVGKDVYGSQYRSSWRGRYGRGQQSFKRGYSGNSYNQTNSAYGNRYQPYRGASRPFRGKYPRRGSQSNESPNEK